MLRLGLLLFFCSISCSITKGIDENKNEDLRILSLIQRYHVQPPVFNGEFSEKTFLNFLKIIDPDQLFLDSTDIVHLSNFRFSLFETPEKTTLLRNTIKPIYQMRLLQYDSLCKLTLQSKLDLQETQNITIRTPQSWSPNGYYEDHGLFIKKWLKYKVLFRMQRLADGQDPIGLTPENAFRYEETARKKILQQESKKISIALKSDKDLEDYLSLSFKRALVNSLDPHSEYFSLKEKTIFEDALSPSKLSFGFHVSINEAGELVVTGVSPGSSAWKSNKLHKGDIITGLVLPDKSIVNIADCELQEIEDIILSPDKTALGFVIRRKNAQTETVHLVKTKIKQDESNVRSYLIHGKIKVGYIILPDFYTEFENNYEYGCSNDVAKAIIKLKKENIQGLIIDLRDNGGGSVREAVDLSGIFIDYGPICTVVNNEGRAFTYKDFNRGLIYSGPLTIMVNKQSASASELFASAMQDYNRAVIIGSPTYGKATSQVIVPCDTDALKKGRKSDYLKLTVQKIYRITNLSNQQKGLIPDIVLPDILDSLPIGESRESSALQAGLLNKKVQFVPLKELPVQNLKMLSQRRVQENRIFTNIKNLSDSIHSLYKCNLNNVPLNILSFSNLDQRKMKNLTTLKNIFETAQAQYSVKTNDIELTSEPDPALNSIAKDIYIQEAYNVINDWNITIQP